MSFDVVVNGARADQTTVRRTNLSVVLRQVAEHGPCSRAEVAAEIGLTRGTVSSLVSELIELELLVEAGETVPRRVGRPGTALGLGERMVAVGLEINVDHLSVRLEDLAGRVRYEHREHRENRGSLPAPVLDRVASLATRAIDEARAAGLVPAGIAVAVPGLVQASSGRLLRAPNLGWPEVDIAGGVRCRLDTDLPIRIDNEANLAALAEHWRGAARGLRSFVAVFGEIGVGAGVFVDGELYRGSHGFGGELGHLTIDRDGLPCACGSRGCLETLVGQEAIARRAGLGETGNGRARGVTEELVRRATAGDPAALESLGEAGRVLGTALASTVNLFDLEGVVLGGAFGPLSQWVVDEVRHALAERVLAAKWVTCEVRTSSFGESAADRGGAALVLNEVFAAPSEVVGRARAET
ncbi:MAG: ROK family protein, partial [Gaiella sp.]